MCVCFAVTRNIFLAGWALWVLDITCGLPANLKCEVKSGKHDISGSQCFFLPLCFGRRQLNFRFGQISSSLCDPLERGMGQLTQMGPTVHFPGGSNPASLCFSSARATSVCCGVLWVGLGKPPGLFDFPGKRSAPVVWTGTCTFLPC